MAAQLDPKKTAVLFIEFQVREEAVKFIVHQMQHIRPGRGLEGCCNRPWGRGAHASV